MPKIDGAVLDVENFAKGKGMAPELARKRLVGSFLRMGNGGLEFQSPLQRDLFRDEYARRHFGGEGAGSDDAFFARIGKDARGRKDEKILVDDLVAAAAIAGPIAAVSGEADAGPWAWAAWRDGARKKPGYRIENEPEYLEIYASTKGAIGKALAPLGNTPSEAWNAMRGGDLDLSRFYGQYREWMPREREVFFAAMRLLADTLPANEKPEFMNNFMKSWERGVSSYWEKAGQGFERFTGGEGPLLPDEKFTITDPHFNEKRDMLARQTKDRLIAKRNFEIDINKIRDRSYDPVKILFPDSTLLRWGEKIAYGLPTTVNHAAGAMLPGGVALTALSGEAMLYEDMRESALLAGAPGDVASEFAFDWSKGMAPVYAGLELVGANAFVRKVPVLDRALNALTANLSRRAVRGGVKVGGTALFETGIETVQKVLPPLSQELASVLDSRLPGPVWKNGKNGHLDGFWEDTAVTFGTMLPLSVFAGIGGKPRHQAYENASDMQLRAFGHAIGQVQKIREAIKAGPEPAARAIAEADPVRDPFSPDAKAAVDELVAEAEQQRSPGPARRWSSS